MSKMHSFSNKFSKIALGAETPQRLLIFNIGNLKFRDLAKWCFLKLIMKKSNFKI